MSLQFSCVSEQNPAKRHPNDDWHGCTNGNGTFVAVVMDGITVPKFREYSHLSGGVASEAAGQAILTFLMENKKRPNGTDLRLAFHAGNEAIERLNEMHRVDPLPLPLGTVGVALWADLDTREAHLGYIGDSMALSVYGSKIELLTRDQVADFTDHLYLYHRDQTFTDDFGNVSFGTPEIRMWQDRLIRNQLRPHCSLCDAPLKGYGSLTGEREAFDFVVIQPVALIPGKRKILASDAFGVWSWEDEGQREFHYDLPLSAVAGLRADQAAPELVRLTRRHEAALRGLGKCRAGSDDLTVMVIDC